MLLRTLTVACLFTPLFAQEPVVEEAPPKPDQAEAPSRGFSQAELEAMAKSLLGPIEALRGARFRGPVAVSLADKKSFREYVQRRMERLMPAERMKAEESLYKLLGLLPPDHSYLDTMMGMLESQVGGFYDPASDRFYLMDTFGGGLAKVIMAHELTHALDDQHTDLDLELQKRLGNSDELFAFQAVVEGSGMVVMNRWMMKNIGKLSRKEITEAGNMGMEGLATVPPALWKPLLAAYSAGSTFLGNAERIDLAFANPPVSSEQILHPKKFWEERDDPIYLDADTSALPAGLRVMHTDVLGEMGATLFCEKPERRKGLRSPLQATSTSFTSKAGTGWGGDRVVVVADGDRCAALWWSIWDDAQHAREFEKAATNVVSYVGGQTNTWSAMQGLESPSITRLRKAGELDAERALLFTSSIGFTAEELAAIEAAVKISIRPKLAVPIESGAEREGPAGD